MKTVLITGASSGIGEETAYIYAKNKHNLILVARRKENLEKIKVDIEKKHSVKVDVIDMDLSLQNSAEDLYKQVTELNLSVDILINNAGFGLKGKFAELDSAREESMLMLNMITLTKLSKLFLKNMLKQNSGHIINIASTAAYQAIPGLAEYSATKAYVLSFSEAVAIELEGTGVNMTVISPGATASEFATTAGFKDSNAFDNVPTSKDLAKFIFESMKDKKISATHGFKNKAMIVGSKFMPRTFIAKMAGKMMN